MSDERLESACAAEGGAAHSAGTTVDACPYAPYSTERYFWINGWHVANFAAPGYGGRDVSPSASKEAPAAGHSPVAAPKVKA